MNIFPVFVLMVLTVYRATRIVTKDDFPPVLWVRDRLAGGWRPLTSKEQETQVNDARSWEDEEKPWPIRWAVQEIDGVMNRYVHRASWSPHWLAELITCPWCASGWIAGCVVGVTDLTVGLPVPWLFGLAVWGAAALLASREWA